MAAFLAVTAQTAPYIDEPYDPKWFRKVDDMDPNGNEVWYNEGDDGWMGFAIVVQELN